MAKRPDLRLWEELLTLQFLEAVDLIGGYKYNNTVAGPFPTATIIMGNHNMVGVSANSIAELRPSMNTVTKYRSNHPSSEKLDDSKEVSRSTPKTIN